MGYHSFIVHVDDSDQSERRLAVAAKLARRHNAALEGLYAVGTRELTPFTSAMLPDAVVATRLHDSGEAQALAEQRFRAAVAREQLTQVTWSAPAGPAVEAAIRHARYADLGIFGQPRAEEDHAAFADDLVHGVLLGSGRPMLVVPYFGEYPTIGESILIAWKQTRESAIAVRDALPLLAKAQKVVLMSIAPPGGADDVGETLSDAGVAAWLARHGIDVKIRQEVASDIDVGNLLLSRAADLSSDLIVMGAYSRTRLSERVLGGATRLMLQAMTVPVLMSH
jgi:nucleotide-binding universal stress UspA family protein